MTIYPLPWRVEDDHFVVADDCELVADAFDPQAANQIVAAVNEIERLRSAAEYLAQQVEQMKGMFDDGDGQIQDALDLYYGTIGNRGS